MNRSQTGKQTAILLVTVANQVSGPVSPRGRFPQLLGRTGICRIPGHGGMDSPPCLQFEDDEDVERSEEQVVDDREIAGAQREGLLQRPSVASSKQQAGSLPEMEPAIQIPSDRPERLYQQQRNKYKGQRW
jgi:hypothetical protein